MSADVNRIVAQVNSKWRPIFRSWTSSYTEDANPVMSEWHKKGTSRVGEFRRLVEELIRVVPEEEGNLTVFLDKLDSLMRKTSYIIEESEEKDEELLHQSEELLRKSALSTESQLSELRRLIKEYKELEQRISDPNVTKEEVERLNKLEERLRAFGKQAKAEAKQSKHETDSVEESIEQTYELDREYVDFLIQTRTLLLRICDYVLSLSK